jgi:hypothetical protein|tara:strand:- start:188 stop:463 length:276 start_codon:yes stop_codon:yes gene_type:complete
MRKRIQKIVQEAIDETAQAISLPQNHFEFRGGTPEQKEGSSNIWIIRLLLGSKGLSFELAATEDSPDDSIKQQALRALGGELRRIGLGDRF